MSLEPQNQTLFLQRCALCDFPKKLLTGLRVQFTSLSITTLSLPATQFGAPVYKTYLQYEQSL